MTKTLIMVAAAALISSPAFAQTPRAVDVKDIVERSLNIAADICIYTNRNLTIEEL